MISLTRRALALSLPAVTVGASGLSPRSASAQGLPGPSSPQRDHVTLLPPTAQFRIGRFTITALTDGYADMPFSYFPGRSAREIEP